MNFEMVFRSSLWLSVNEYKSKELPYRIESYKNHDTARLCLSVTYFAAIFQSE
jgi:hypothetical protein